LQWWAQRWKSDSACHFLFLTVLKALKQNR
jgi:hypothetical protein